jgi:leucyl-tRNA synthetase
MEHTTLHLLYSRFWDKFLHDCGLVPTAEPYARRTSHGFILGEGGEKMSKSRGNVVRPDQFIAQYGADAFRCYKMFIGPFDQTAYWDSNGIEGTARFLQRVWRLVVDEETGRLSPKLADTPPDQETLAVLHRTIKVVTEHINEMKFNTAIAQMMIFVNEMYKKETLFKAVLKDFILVLSPFAPHICEELWQKLGGQPSTLRAAWPSYDPKYLVEEIITMVVQVNGKVRASLQVPADISNEEIKRLAQTDANVQRHIEGKAIKKMVVVPKKLVSIVV